MFTMSLGVRSPAKLAFTGEMRHQEQRLRFCSKHPFLRFMLVIISLSSGSQMENIEKIFYMMDFDKNGIITSEVNFETDNE